MQRMIFLSYIFLTACASSPEAVQLSTAADVEKRARAQICRAPAELLTPCRAPLAPAELLTNADLATYLSGALEAFELCAAEHAALIEFYEKFNVPENPDK